MSKKIVVVGSGILAAVLIISDRIGTSVICGWAGQDTICMGILYDIMMNLFPLIPFFFLSLITYKMRDEIYRAWLRFAYVWIPLSMLLIFLAPQYSSDWMYPIEKGTVAFFSSLLFVIISLVLIAWKYLSTRNKGV